MLYKFKTNYTCSKSNKKYSMKINKCFIFKSIKIMLDYYAVASPIQGGEVDSHLWSVCMEFSLCLVCFLHIPKNAD